MDWPSYDDAQSLMTGKLLKKGIQFDVIKFIKVILIGIVDSSQGNGPRVPISFHGDVDWQMIAGHVTDMSGKTSEFRLGKDLWQKQTRNVPKKTESPKESSDEEKNYSSDDSISGIRRSRSGENVNDF